MRARAKTRVFLDSNVIFSGLHSPDGAPGNILERFIEGDFLAVISQQVLEELVRTIKEKLPAALPALRSLLLSAPPEVCKDAAPEEVARWARVIHEEDAPILAAAVAARPDLLVTGDAHFLSSPGIAKKSGLRILTPARFLKLMEGED